MKNIIGKVIKAVGEETARITVNEASVWLTYQEEEPAEARERFLEEE